MRRLHRINKVTVLFALGFVLMGCSTVVPVTDKAYPPASLVQDCPVPRYRIELNKDLAEAIVLLKGALSACNNDKAALRLWMEDIP